MYRFLLSLVIIGCLVACNAGSKSDALTRKTEKGTEYIMLRDGKGAKSKIGDFVKINIDGYDMKGDVKFSSQDNPQPTIMNILADNPNAPANPIVDVVKALGMGDSVKIIATPELMNNQNGADTIIYYIGLEKIYSEAEFKQLQEEVKQKAMERYNSVDKKAQDLYSKLSSQEMKSKTLTTDSGLKYIILEEGKGRKTTVGQEVVVDYHGLLARSGQVFDSSFKRTLPFKFVLGIGQVIKGWDEGLALLNRGSKALLLVPSELAYGDRDSGIIKKGDDLIFYVEVK